MPAHQRIQAWTAQNYQRPAIDQEWLADCSDWVTSELGLDPDRDFDQFIQHVEAQLLQSNLADSTVPGSGIDPRLVASNPNAARPRLPRARRPVRQPRQNNTTGPTPLLVEIKSITEIAYSAFNLLNIHQTRLDRADLGLAREDNAEQHPDEDEGPVPRFPRGMLRFELSDGLTTFRAIEFRPLPQLELGTTPLGYKMVLKSTPIRNNIAFLEPSNVTLRGYRTEDHDINSQQIFLSSLRKRLGRPDPPPEARAATPPPVNPPNQPPAQPAHQHPQPVAQSRSPPADTDEMYADDVDPDVLREMAIQMDEATNTPLNQRAGVCAAPPVRPPLTSKEQHSASSDTKRTSRLGTMVASSSLRASSSSSTAKASPYFTAHSSGSKMIPDIGLSPRPDPPPSPSRSIPSVTKLGSTFTRPSSAASAKDVSPEKWPASPDPFDDLSFDMDVDESFYAQVGMIEQGALDVSTDKKGKDKGKDTGTESTTSYCRPSVPSARKTPSSLVLGMKFLAPHPISPSGTEPSMRIQDSAKSATRASSLSGSTESPIPRSTQSSDRRMSRDPSLIVISSDEEMSGGYGTVNPPDPTQRRTHKRKAMNQDVAADSDVIEISD